MPWSREKNREYRRHGDGRDRKREADRSYAKANRDAIRDRALARPVAPGAPERYACKKCGEDKPFTPEFFTYRPAMKYKLTYTCRRCQNENSLAHQVKSRYGLTLEQARELRAKSTCTICGTKDRLHIDHSHKTGKVRSVLCTNCNTGIGMFKESADMLRAAADYIELFCG